MTAEEILKKAKSVFNAPLSDKPKPEVELEKEVKVEMGEIITEDGTTIYFDNELTEGSPIWFLVDGENVPVPVGEYALPSGRILIVTEAGIAATVTPEVRADAPIADVVAEENQQLSADDIKAIVLEAIKPLEEKVTKLSAEKETAEQEVRKLKTELSDQPASKGVKASPEGKINKAIGVSLSRTKQVGLGKIYEMLYS